MEEYDSLDYSTTPAEDVQALLQNLSDIVADVTDLGDTRQFFPQIRDSRIDGPRTPTIGPAVPATPPPSAEKSSSSFIAVVMTGYASAFSQHAGIAAWQIILSRENPCTWPTPRGWPHVLTEEDFRVGCERHVQQVCAAIDELANHRFGMITASPLLFLLDSAWLGYCALRDLCGYDLDEVRPWFVRIAEYVSSTGYKPLREPWLIADMNFDTLDESGLGST